MRLVNSEEENSRHLPERELSPGAVHPCRLFLVGCIIQKRDPLIVLSDSSFVPLISDADQAIAATLPSTVTRVADY